MDYLRQASDRSQVVLTTHSPELLNLVQADEVRVVERSSNGTCIQEMAEDQRTAVRKRLLRLGDLMTTEGLRIQARGSRQPRPNRLITLD